MEQLIMNWTNDGTEARMPVLPEGVGILRLPEVENGPEEWLSIIRYMGKTEDPSLGYEVFRKSLSEYRDFDENLCFFLTVDGEIAATITVICHRAEQQGYIHMVASKPQFRGRGLGHLMNELAVCVLKEQGMPTAYLTTDDWRLAAIKTYLKAGFVPDTESLPEFAGRWQKVLQDLGMN